MNRNFSKSSATVPGTYVSGWWTKPTFAAPLTPVQSDGIWTTDVTTGGIDQLATEFAAFLVPNGYTPPTMSGGQTLPAELFTYPNLTAEREAVYRALDFSGHTWKVKASESPAGPGPNYFSDAEEDAWVDDQGRLHLSIVYRDGHRIILPRRSGSVDLRIDTYTFTLASRVDLLDPNIVLGQFTWDDTAPKYNYREMDIEFSRWGVLNNDNAQFVVQPWSNPGNLYRFDRIC